MANSKLIYLNNDGCVDADNEHCSTCIYGYSIDKENKYYTCRFDDTLLRLNTLLYPMPNKK